MPADEPAMQGQVTTETAADLVVRDIMTQVVLNIGSRSFSHFLNIVERYHALLRQLSSTPAMRTAILASTTRFWARSPQWVQIVFDKLMQYRIVEPADIVTFIFSPALPESVPATILQGSGDFLPSSFSKLLDPTMPGDVPTRDWACFDWYELLRLTVEKVNGRVGQVRRRLARLQREEAEEAERKEAAAAGLLEEEAAATSPPPPPVKTPFSFPTSASLPKRPDLPTTAPTSAAPAPAAPEEKRLEEEQRKRQTVEEARSALDSILGEQRKVLAGAFRGLTELHRATSLRVKTLTSSTKMEDEEEEGADDTETSTAQEELEWRAWWIKEAYLAYLRQFSKDFVTIQETLRAVFVKQDEEEEVRRWFEEACKMAYE